MVVAVVDADSGMWIFCGRVHGSVACGGGGCWKMRRGIFGEDVVRLKPPGETRQHDGGRGG